MKTESPEFYHLQLIDMGLALHIDDDENRARKMTPHIPAPFLQQARARQKTRQGRANGHAQGLKQGQAMVEGEEMLEQHPTAVHVGTRGYRGPHLLRTHRCEYQDDLWVAALIVVEMALGKCVYTHHAKPLLSLMPKDKMIQRITTSVLNGAYIPWEQVSVHYPHLPSFLRRITRDEKPYIETAMDALRFIRTKDNQHIFQPISIT